MNSQVLRKLNIPKGPGVYFFMKKGSILYIGKATSLKDRTKSYFSSNIINSRGPLIIQMVNEADNIKWQETDSVLEALILEASLIKKYQPKYNTKEKDNKSFNYVCITKPTPGVLAKVLVVRKRNLKRPLPNLPFTKGEEKGGGPYSAIYGPFPNGNLLKEAMKIVRRIFSYIDQDSIKKQNKEFYDQLKLNPKDLNEYKNNIKNIQLFFEGKKKNIISNLKKEMMSFAKDKEFEKANEIKKRIFALTHINDISLIKGEISERFISEYRMEAYDVAHMSGKNMVGVMTVVEDGEIKKSEYKKFIIKSQTGTNDTGALEEILSRRLRHTEWGIPDLIIVDGGKAQINVAKRVINKYQFLDINIVSVLKDDKHKAKEILGDKNIINKNEKYILLANSEAHRFAITFHKKRRNKDFIK
ncbi:TPA: hypothetical protein DIC38_03500 [Candidatus Nomurabacteria bacterium]|nr:MAG: hypothetical protein O210_OD1C00001G0081 [Parcubacteria bacterium RAAC4_OD1_1]HCY26713.1 hypothetical protein [Candidatus Nomurabacteria bacterium]